MARRAVDPLAAYAETGRARPCPPDRPRPVPLRPLPPPGSRSPRPYPPQFAPYRLTIPELAHFIGVGETEARRLVYQSREIPSHRYGRTRRVLRPDAEAWCHRVAAEGADR